MKTVNPEAVKETTDLSKISSTRGYNLENI